MKAEPIKMKKEETIRWRYQEDQQDRDENEKKRLTNI